MGKLMLVSLANTTGGILTEGHLWQYLKILVILCSYRFWILSLNLDPNKLYNTVAYAVLVSYVMSVECRMFVRLIHM